MPVLRCLLGAALGYLLVMALGSGAIHSLRRFCSERIDTASSRLAALHAQKAGTPSMGGILIFGCWFAAIAACCDFADASVSIAAAAVAAFTALGACDDLIKFRGRRGLRARTKLAGQLIISMAAVAALQFTDLAAESFSLWPMLLSGLFITAISNAVNITDGLDGLAAGCGALAAVALAVVALLLPTVDGLSGNGRLGDIDATWWLGQSWASLAQNARFGPRPSDAPARGYRGIDAAPTMNVSSSSNGCVSAPATAPRPSRPDGRRDAVRHEQLALLAAVLAGTLVGFLWFNRSPARIFMGDAGSLPLGGLLGLIATMLHCEWLLLVVGGVFVAELASVVLQVAWFRRTGRRLFRCAPLHHHYEFLGWRERMIVRRFWAAAAACALAGLLLLPLAPRSFRADGKIGTPLECGDSSPLSLTAEPSFRGDRNRSCAFPCTAFSHYAWALPKNKGRFVTKESGDKSPHSKAKRQP